MSGKLGWFLAAAIVVAMGSQAQAQVGITIGNPYRGGIMVNTPAYGYGPNRPVYGPTYYNSGYAGYAPAMVYPTTRIVPAYGYRPYGGYGGGYGYRPYGRGYGRRR